MFTLEKSTWLSLWLKNQLKFILPQSGLRNGIKILKIYAHSKHYYLVSFNIHRLRIGSISPSTCFRQLAKIHLQPLAFCWKLPCNSENLQYHLPSNILTSSAKDIFWIPKLPILFKSFPIKFNLFQDEKLVTIRVMAFLCCATLTCGLL